MKLLSENLHQFLMNPRRVFTICLIFAASGIVLDGTFYKIWALNNEKKNMEVKIVDVQKSLHTLQNQVKMAHDPKFIEREARDRFDLVNKDDIVFVFAEE
jgi:cell division protein FtsB